MGNEALFKAARKWVPKNNARFATYAKPFIIRGVRRAIDNEWGLIRLPVNVSEEIRRVKYAERSLMQRLGRDPTNEEVAQEAKTHPDRVVQLNNLIARGPISLESFSPENFQEEDEE
jgi:RNA polymerase primary sigma factor